MINKNYKVELTSVSQIKDKAGYSYTYSKYANSNNNKTMDKGEFVGTITINDYEGDGFDNHDGVENNNFGAINEPIFSEMMSKDKTKRGYQDTDLATNPSTNATYADIKGTKDAEGEYTITSNKNEESNLGSLAKQLNVNSNTNGRSSSSSSATNIASAYQMSTGGNGNLFGGFNGNACPTNPDVKVDYAKLNAAYNQGVNGLNAALGGFGFSGPYSADFSQVKTPGETKTLWDNVYAAFGGVTPTNNKPVVTETKKDVVVETKKEESTTTSNINKDVLIAIGPDKVETTTDDKKIVKTETDKKQEVTKEEKKDTVTTNKNNKKTTTKSKLTHTTYHKGEVIKETEKGQVKTYTDKNGNKITETYEDGFLVQTETQNLKKLGTIQYFSDPVIKKHFNIEKYNRTVLSKNALPDKTRVDNTHELMEAARWKNEMNENK